MTQQPNIRDEFEESYIEWSKAIIKYCKESQLNNSALQAMLLNDGMFLGNSSNKCVTRLLHIMQVFT